MSWQSGQRRGSLEKMFQDSLAGMKRLSRPFARDSVVGVLVDEAVALDPLVEAEAVATGSSADAGS